MNGDERMGRTLQREGRVTCRASEKDTDKSFGETLQTMVQELRVVCGCDEITFEWGNGR